MDDSHVDSFLCFMSGIMTGYTHTEGITKKCWKLAYNSFREAQEVINYSKKHRYSNGKRRNKLMGKKDKQLQRSYKCDECGMWHITSQKERDV